MGKLEQFEKKYEELRDLLLKLRGLSKNKTIARAWDRILHVVHSTYNSVRRKGPWKN